MKNCKSILLILIIILVLPCSIYAISTIENTDKAVILSEIGLFQGTDKGFELDRAPTRTESGVMLVRLLGVEEEAKENKYKHPFTDVPEWANDYIGYMYENGLTTGISADKFGASNLIDGKSYTTFVLRALGYSDIKGDFSWSNALEFSNGISLLNKHELDTINQQDFKRDELVLLSYNALMTKLKDSTKTLGEKLAEGLVIRPHLALANNIIDKNNYEIIPVVVKDYKGHLINDYYLSNIKNYEELNVAPILFTGVWEEPLSEFELLVKLTMSKGRREEFKKYVEEYENKLEYKDAFIDDLNDPQKTSPGYYSVLSLYDAEGILTYFAEIPKGLGLSIGEYELPLFAFNKELIKKAEIEVNKIDEIYNQKRKDIVVFSDSAVKIENKDKKRDRGIMYIDRSKLPEAIQDFVYVTRGGSNSNDLEFHLYNDIKKRLLGEGETLTDTNHKYNDETGTSIGNNVYVNVFLYNIDGEIIGAAVVENTGRILHGDH